MCGSVAISACTSGSAATEVAQSRKHGESPASSAKSAYDSATGWKISML